MTVKICDGFLLYGGDITVQQHIFTVIVEFNPALSFDLCLVNPHGGVFPVKKWSASADPPV
ncbi:hypothetical protein BA171_02500 [Candidatus Hamiltonella defensa (Bemisia tabaci)]|uniref:Uncharacterized protein n=1 Tax=Candidatus Hamiltonella defensa (Bemisia tabaci) TaxID=672795 RepID=A0A249DYN1_9ENTR|nr:hypothetical protein BA171_02500 [Candidatus Hamiltonella defensa (Bemisia tabaci)]